MTSTAGLVGLGVLVVLGAAAGLVGRALAGPRRPGAVGAVLLGLVGSFGGGFGGYLLAAKPPGGGLPPAGWAGAAAGAVLAALVLVAVGRTGRRPRA